MCVFAGNLKKDNKLTNLISVRSKSCGAPYQNYIPVDTRSSPSYFWKIERFVLDRDQNNMKAIGLPIDGSGNPYASGPENQMLYIIDMNDNTPTINPAKKRVLALRF